MLCLLPVLPFPAAGQQGDAAFDGGAVPGAAVWEKTSGSPGSPGADTRRPGNVSPPSRIGAPLAGSLALQRWKTGDWVEEVAGIEPNMDWESRLSWAIFDSPDALSFDTLQFLNQWKAGLENPWLGKVRIDVMDKWLPGVENGGNGGPRHAPELRRLTWQWSVPGLPVSTTIGRQRLTTGGDTSIGSVSWLPDKQVFDGFRADIGDEGKGGKWTAGLFYDLAMAGRHFAGPRPGDNPLFLLAHAVDWREAGKLHAYALGNTANPDDAAFGFHWRQPVPPGRHPVWHAVDMVVTPGNGGWHLAMHRQTRDSAWHAGAELVAAGDGGSGVSATPGTYRYLPDGLDADAWNLFCGFDRRLDDNTLASLVFQSFWDEESWNPAAGVIEVALRHQFSPAAVLLGGTGLGVESTTGEAFLRTGVQFSAAY